MVNSMWQCAGFKLDTDRPLIMGILNVTPDSFSDGGSFYSVEAACAQARLLIGQGARIIDVGGESTRPGSCGVSVDEELSRVLPVVSQLAGEGSVVSIDTRHALVTRACVDAGAAIINDISGFRDQAMVEVATECEAGLIVMHMLGEPQSMQTDPRYDDVVREVSDYLLGQAFMLEAAGIAHERIAIDPGPGFGKSFEHNLALLQATTMLASLGYPLVAAWSRKGFIGQLTGVQKPAERLVGSVAVSVYAASSGARILRVHDVAATVEALKISEALNSDQLKATLTVPSLRDECNSSWQSSHRNTGQSRRLSDCSQANNPHKGLMIQPSIPHRAIIGLGSNVGNSAAILKAAIERIAALPGLTLIHASSLYESEPAYRKDQDIFCNAVIEVQTWLEPTELLKLLQGIEEEFGRSRGLVNGPRTLDLDIVDYEGVVSDDPELLLPHPLALERDFVVRPLQEIAADYVFADGQPLTRDQIEQGYVLAQSEPVMTETLKGKPLGILSICATPIGNLGDITQRVIDTLAAADVVLAEDTRVARRLLSHLNIRPKIERCDENTIRQRAPEIIERIKQGSRMAYISDAGMPGISDPGAVLIEAAQKAGCLLEVLPGASSVLTAVVASGFPAQAFYFGGFLPRKKPQILAALESLSQLDATLVFFESPHRASASLTVIAEVFPEREAAIARELTKLHEEVQRAPTIELAQQIAEREKSGRSLKGELVLLIGPPPKNKEKRAHRDKYAEKPSDPATSNT